MLLFAFFTSIADFKPAVAGNLRTPSAQQVEPKNDQEKPRAAASLVHILSRREQTGEPGCCTAVNNLKAAAKMLNFLQENQIMDMDGLTIELAGMFGEQRVISKKLKPIGSRLKTLDGHISGKGRTAGR